MTFCGWAVDCATFIENETTPTGAAAQEIAAHAAATTKRAAFMMNS